MSESPIKPEASTDGRQEVPRRFNIRVVLLLLVLTAVISASVITVDIFSPRDRHAGTATATGKGTAP